jgi:hypothetical protein
VNCASALLHNTVFAPMFLGQQRRQLLMVFALSVRYRTVDVTLAVSCGILPLLLRLSKGNEMKFCMSSNGIGHVDLGAVIKIASMHLLQILAVTARFALLIVYCYSF